MKAENVLEIDILEIYWGLFGITENKLIRAKERNKYLRGERKKKQISNECCIWIKII